MKKHILTLAFLAAFALPFAAMPTVAHASPPVVLAQGFENATGLKNISNPTNSGVDTEKLGIYGPAKDGSSNLITIISNIINSVFLLLGFTAVVLLIVEGVLLILARDNEDRRKKVTATIINIAIGFGVILLSYAIVDQILRVLGDTNLNSRETGIETTTDLSNQIGLGSLTNMNSNALDGVTPGTLSDCWANYGSRRTGERGVFCNQIWNVATTTLESNKRLFINDPNAMMGIIDRMKDINAETRSTDLEFVLGALRIQATRGQVLRYTKAEWDALKSNGFNLFIPGNSDLTEARAWVSTGFSYSLPADAVSLSSTNSTAPNGTTGKLLNLSALANRIQVGVQKPNVIQVRIPNLTTANITIVVVTPEEEESFLFTPGEAFGDYNPADLTTTRSWADVSAGTVQGYDRRKSFFTVKNKSSSLDQRTYTTGASIQLNDGSGDVDIEAEITLDDKNQLPENFQSIEHILRRGDGVLVKDNAKSGDKVSLTIPVGQNVYLIDDMTAILKDGKRINLGTNTISIGNNSNARLTTLSGLGQVVLDGTYSDVTGNKTVKLMPNDSISLTRSGENPVKMALDLKYYTKEAPTLIDIVSAGFDTGFVRFTDAQIVQGGAPLNGVTPYNVKSELSFDEPGVYPVTVAIRDYTVGRTLATMQLNISVVTDGTALEVSPGYAGVVGGTYRIRTFPTFASNSSLESKRVEIVRVTDTGSGGQTIHNRTLNRGLDDFEYIFDQDGEYIIKLFNKFSGAASETQVSKQIMVMPQSPQVDFELKEKSGNPTVYELADLSKYVDSGTVFVDFSPFDAGISQSDWQTAGSRRVKTLTFSKPGTYRVTVSGRNRFGEISSKSRDVTINTDVTYDIQLQDAQGNTFPQNQTPRFVTAQSFATRVVGRNISKIEVSYGNNSQPLLTMTNPATQPNGQMTFTGNMQLAEQGPYSLLYTFYSVSRPTEKALVVTKSVLIRRPLEPLADFSVSQNGAVLSATPGLCSVAGSSREGYLVKKNQEYTFDGSASLASSDLPVNRDANNMTFRWNMGSQQLASRTVTIRDRFTAQSTDANSCVPVTFTILETVNGQAKTSQLVKYFKVENSLPTYDSFVVEWPTGALTTPLSVKAKLRGLRDPDEPNQNIQVLWFYEIQGNQLFNEVSYDSERIVRIENYGAEGSQNTVRVGAQIFDMNTKESVKVYSDQRSLKTGTNPALRTSLVQPQMPQGLTYIPWVKSNSPLNIRIASTLSNGATLENPEFSWSTQRYGTFAGCPSVAEEQANAVNGTSTGASVAFPLCGLYRVTAIVTANGQRSQQSIPVKVYDTDTLLSEAEKPAYLAASNLRGSSGEPTATYIPSQETSTSPFFPTATGSKLLASNATYGLGLSPFVASQAVTNGSYTGSGVRLTASYDAMYDMLTSYNLPPSAIYDRLAQDDPNFAAQLEQLRASGKKDDEIRELLAQNLAGSSINYNPKSSYNVPFGIAYDVYSEFGLRPAATLDKLSKEDPALGKRVQDLRSSGANDASIVQTLRNQNDLIVQTNLHEPTEVKASEIGSILTSQGLSLQEIVDKIILDNPALEEKRADLLASASVDEMLQKVEEAGSAQVVFQPLAPLRMTLSRAYQIMKERAYTDALILDKLLADDPEVRAKAASLENRGVASSALLRELLTEPGREVNLRVAGAIQSNFQTIFATLKRHGLSTATIYEKMMQDDEVFRVVYEAARKKTSDMSGYYQQFAQEPTLYKLTYKPETTFVLPLKLAYAEYIAMGFTPTQVFERIARDNPNFGTDYETLKRERSGGVEIFESLVKNGSARKVRFSYMKSFDLPVDTLPAFFQRQGIPAALALEKIVQDNPRLAKWYASETANGSVATFSSLQTEFPRETLAVSLFTGWDSKMGSVGQALSNWISPAYAVRVIAGADSELARLIDTLRNQSKTDAEIYVTLLDANEARSVRMYPYMHVPVALNDGARLLSTLYASHEVILSHLARFDDSFSDFYTLAQERLYSTSATLERVGTREVHMAAFRPVLASAQEMLQSIEMTGLSLATGLEALKDSFPEIANILEDHTSADALVVQVSALYPVEQKLPVNMLYTEQNLQKINQNLGWNGTASSMKDYLSWLRGWGISSDVGLAQLAISDARVAVALTASAGLPIDERVAAVEAVAGQVKPMLHKRFVLPFVDAYRVYERRGLSTGLIYGFLGAQDPVFQSVYEEQRLARTAERGLFDVFKESAKTASVVTNPLLPARLSTAYVARLLTSQDIPAEIVAKKLLADQPALVDGATPQLSQLLTNVARNAYVQTLPLSLTKPVSLTEQEKQALFEAYGVTSTVAQNLARQTGSGLTLPPQVTVDIQTYVQEAQEQGIGRSQIIEDVIRLLPEKAFAMRTLAETDQTAQLASAMSSVLDANTLIPLLTKVLPSTADEPAVVFGAMVNGGMQQLSGYIPGTLPSSTASGAYLAGGQETLESRVLGNIKQTLMLPGGFQAELFNSRLHSTDDAFRFQSIESVQGLQVVEDSTALGRLTGLLSASGSLLRSSASSEISSPAMPNVFGIAGETTLLACDSFSVVLTMTGEQTLVCSTSTLYENSLDTFKTVLLRVLGETFPEELSTLINAFDRAKSLEDRQEAMVRLRDRVTRLAVNEVQREDLLRRLSFVKIFDLTDADAGQLVKRNGDALLQRLEKILTAAGSSMITDRGGIASAFDTLATQNEVSSVLLVRYALAMGDLMRSQTVDSAVKDLVLKDFVTATKELTARLQGEADQIAGVASADLKQRLSALNTHLAQPAYTYLWVSDTIIRSIRELPDITSMPESGKTSLETIMTAWVKALGSSSAAVMREGIPQVADQNTALQNEIHTAIVTDSIWNRQRSGLIVLVQKIADASEYNAQQKQEILAQLLTARKSYFTDVRTMIQGADFVASTKASLLQKVDAVLAATNMASLLELESSLWQVLEAQTSLEESAQFVPLWYKTAEYQQQFAQATSNVLQGTAAQEVLSYFSVTDSRLNAAKKVLAALPAQKTSAQNTALEAFKASANVSFNAFDDVVTAVQTMLDNPASTMQQKMQVYASFEQMVRRFARTLQQNNDRTGVDLLASLRSSINTRLQPLVSSNPGLRTSAHIVHDMKKLVLAHPELPLQYKLEMLFELQQAYPFYPFTRAFSLCTPVYVKNNENIVRQICAEEKNQGTEHLPVEKAQLFALMETAAANKPQISSASLSDIVTTTINTLTKEQSLSLEARRQHLSALAQAFEWPDVSFSDRNAALAYVYSLPVISDEMLQLQETRLSLETYYISLGELESRLRAIMLGVNELPDALKGAVREALMQVKKYYSTDTQRSNVMLSLAGNVIRGSELQQARKDMLVRVLDTLGDTVQAVPVDRLLPEVSLEQIDTILTRLTSVPSAQSLFADREDVARLLSQNDILGAIGALTRFEQRIGAVEGLSPEERSDLGFYTAVSRNFLTYAQSQGPRVPDVVPDVPEETVIDPVQQPVTPLTPTPVSNEPSVFWAILWGIVYIFSGVILLIFVLGIVLYVLFLSYKRSHPDIHVDFEEYILVLRGQLATFFKRFSKEEESSGAIYRVPDEELPQKPAEAEEAPAPVSDSPAPTPTPTPTPTPAPVASTIELNQQSVSASENIAVTPPAEQMQSAPSWMQLGYSDQSSASPSVNPSENVQPSQNGVQSDDIAR